MGCRFYGQHKLTTIHRMFLNPKNIILDVKFPPVFFGINFATTLYGFFLCQEVFYHVFGKPDNSA